MAWSKVMDGRTLSWMWFTTEVYDARRRETTRGQLTKQPSELRSRERILTLPLNEKIDQEV